MSWQALCILKAAGAVDDQVVLRHVACKELSEHSVQRMAALHAARTGGQQPNETKQADAARGATKALPEGLAEREVAFWRDKGCPTCKCELPTCIVQATSKEQGGRFIVKCLARYKVSSNECMYSA